MLINEVFTELIMIAEEDLRSAKILANDYKPPIEISCYHCQQCAEKSLKAYLSFHYIKHKFTHDLDVLCSDCQQIDQGFLQLSSECKVLNDYIKQTRYTKKYDLTEFNMRQAIEHAEKILEFVKAKTAPDGESR